MYSYTCTPAVQDQKKRLHIKTSHVFIRVQVQNSESDKENMRISVVV